ncbi:hypothetical protein PIROE2DRAFT_2132 [Piromyces sp. E2]|nr:hypothetical protein PIROE2DRAFT_2132 [Piromyces sp. E2]|eukprot:OUM69932.1 hypothetical protein PIROE2DRAFT_2132 [Piromyces sp. E2]
MGIGKYIKKDNQLAAIEAFKYLTSLNLQKKYLKDFLINTAIFSLYDDEDVCADIDCEFYKSLQPITRPGSKTKNYNEYSGRFRKYIYDYLYGNITAKEALQNVENIIKVYKVSSNPKESIIGFISTVFISILAVSMFVSLIVLFIDDFNPFFEFLPWDFWIINVIGAVLMLCSCFLHIGDLTAFKCQFHLILTSMGISLNFIPMICKLIINFPDYNYISNWTYKHRHFFVLIFLSIEIVIDGLSLLRPYSVKDINANSINEGKNFQICKMSNSYGKFFIWLMMLYKFIIISVLTLLIFIEWNIKTTSYDIKFIMSALCGNLFLD